MSLLNSDLLLLRDAAALVIGADLGTTSTTILGSLGRSIAKKQLALAQLLYNVIVNTFVFIVLLPLLPYLLETFGLQDKMFGLVAFHSVFNVIGLAIFLPALKIYPRFIERCLPLQTPPQVEYFNVLIEVPEAAIKALKKSVEQLAKDALRLNLLALDLELSSSGLFKALELPGNVEESYASRYEALKTFEARIDRFANKIQKVELTEEQSSRITQLLESTRAVVYANKTLKDVRDDFLLLRSAYEQSLGAKLSEAYSTFFENTYGIMIPLLFGRHSRQYIAEELESLSELNGEHHQAYNALVEEHFSENITDNLQVSTWFN